MAWEFELVAGPFKGPAGGLAWDGEAMLFSLISAGRILRYDPGSHSHTEVRKWTHRTNGIAFSPKGYLYGAQAGARRIVRFNDDGSAAPMEHRVGGRVHNHPNDLVFDRKGRIWFTDPHSSIPTLGPQLDPPLEHASVLCLDLEKSVDHISRMTFDTRAPLGLALSTDEKTLYVSESSEEPDGRRELRAYPIGANGALGSCSVLATFGGDHRGPHRGVEGMCLDAEGNILACAGWARSGPGPLVYVFTPSGRVLESHPVPAGNPMKCAFGDAGLGTLYVTTGEGIEDGEGRLYRVRNTGRKGLPLSPTRG